MTPLQKAIEHHQAGNLTEAIALYRSILKGNPTHPDALQMMGVIAQQMGKPELALNLIEASLASLPSYAQAWVNRAIVLRTLNRKEEALKSVQQALDLDPSLSEAWDFAGSLLRQLKKFSEARVHHDRALALQPHNRNFRYNYAALLLATGDVMGAYKAVAHKGQEDTSLSDDLPLMLGNIWQAAGYPEKAIIYFHETFQRHPQLFSAQVNEAFANLKIGNLEHGLALAEIREDRSIHLFQHIPVWHGQNVDHLVLYEDQGLGDALFAARYIPMVQKRARQLTLYLMTPALAALFESSFPGLSVVVHDQPVPGADARCQLLSLPYIFKTSLDTIPNSVPYLKPPVHTSSPHTASSHATSPWLDLVSSSKKPRIGVVWAGNTSLPTDHNRSLSFQQFDPLWQIGKGHFISLQKGLTKNPGDFAKASLIDADPQINTFADTAGLLDHLDLVISVDTAVAHLAGALGKPVWLLVLFDPDWRWMLDREDSPWYPTMRIFRQSKPGDWNSVVQRIAVDLKKYIDGDLSVIKPEKWTSAPARQNKHALPLTGQQ